MQVYYILIGYLPTLWNGYSSKLNNHLFPYKVLTVLLTVVLVLYTVPSLACLFYYWKFVPLNSLRLFRQTLQPLPSPLAITSLLSMSLSLFSFCFVYLFCFLDSTYKWDGTAICLCVYISLSTVPSGSIHVGTNCKLWSSFYVLDTDITWYWSVIWQ